MGGRQEKQNRVQTQPRDGRSAETSTEEGGPAPAAACCGMQERTVVEISMAGSRGEASDAIRLLQRRLTILTCDTAHAMPTTLLLLQQTPTSARAPSPSLPNCQQALYSAAQRHQLTHHPSRELTARLLSALASLACMLRQGACVRVSTFVFLATSAAFFLFPLAFL